MMHGNATGHGKCAIERTAKISARQRGSRAHGKEKRHGKERSQRTAKKHRTAKAGPAHGKENTHGKAFALRFSPFAVRFARTAKHCSPVVSTKGAGLCIRQMAVSWGVI
jgi:hypothetical protein